MIRHNLFWKLFALVVAIGLWSYVNAERNPQSNKTFTVPIETHNLGKGYIADFVRAREAVVSIHGPQKMVDAIRKEDVSAWVQVPKQSSKDGASQESVDVHARVSGIAPNEVSISVSPKRASLRVEAIRLKRLPVEVKFLSPPPLGYSYSEPQMDPSSIAISGKTSAVSKVRKVVIAVSGEQKSRVIDDDLKALPVDSKGNVVRDVNLDKDIVHLKLRFVETPATKVLLVSPIVIGQPKYPVAVSRVSVSPPTVTVQGRPVVLMGLSTVSTEPVQIEGTETTISKEVPLQVPDGAQVLGRNKVRVTVFVTSPQ